MLNTNQLLTLYLNDMTLSNNKVKVDDMEIPLFLVAKAFDHYIGVPRKFKAFLIDFYQTYLNNYNNSK